MARLVSGFKTRALAGGWPIPFHTRAPLTGLDFGGYGRTNSGNYYTVTIPELPNADWAVAIRVRPSAGKILSSFWGLFDQMSDTGTVPGVRAILNSGNDGYTFTSIRSTGGSEELLQTQVPYVNRSVVVVTQRRGSSYEQYVCLEGESAGSPQTAAVSGTTIPTSTWRIGSDQFGFHAPLVIGEFAVVLNDSLTAAEVTQLAAGAHITAVASPTVDLRFRSGPVTTETNLGSGGSANDASKVGSGFWLARELFPESAATESRTLSAAGAGAATWQGASVVARAISAAGGAAATFASASIAPSALSAAGLAAASWQSASVLGRAVTSAGIAAVSWQGGAVIGQTWTSAGVGTAAFASASIAPSTLSTAGLAAATWQSAALKVTQWSAAGVAATAWQSASITAAAWTSAGQGAAAWQGARIEPRTFSASGAATVSFDADTGATIEARTFSAAGAASADWQAAAGQGGQPVHEIDIGASPLWWHRRDEAESEPKARRKSSGKPSPTKPAEDAAQQARRVIEQAARQHVAQGDLTRNARYADVRLALKPLHVGAIEWTAMYEAMYSLALNDAIARELEIEAQLQDEDDALILLMAA